MLIRNFYLSFCLFLVTRQEIDEMKYISARALKSKEAFPLFELPLPRVGGIADASRLYRLNLPPAGHNPTPQVTSGLKSVVWIITGCFLKFFAFYEKISKINFCRDRRGRRSLQKSIFKPLFGRTFAWRIGVCRYRDRQKTNEKSCYPPQNRQKTH